MIYTTLSAAWQLGTALASTAIVLLVMSLICALIILDMRRRKEPL